MSLFDCHDFITFDLLVLSKAFYSSLRWFVYQTYGPAARVNAGYRTHQRGRARTSHWALLM